MGALLLTNDIRISRVMDGVAAGTTDQNGTAVDMAADGGYDGVLFVGLTGVLTATQVTQLKAQVSSDSGVGDAWADLAGSQTPAMADDDDDQVIGLDIWQPPERYVRAVFERGTANAVIDGILAIQYRGRSRPTTHDAATVQAVTTVIQAAEGTV